MHRFPLIAFLATLASFAGVAAPADDGASVYPVRTTTVFEGGSFEVWRSDVERRLDEAPIEFIRRYIERDETLRREVRSCSALLSALSDEFEPDPPFMTRSEEAFIYDLIRNCRVIRRIEQARASHRSFLADFRLNQETPQIVPWLVSNFGLTVDSTGNRIRADAERRRLSWAAWRREAYCEVKRYGDWYSWVAALDDVLASHVYDVWAFDLTAWEARASCGDPPPLHVDLMGPYLASYVEPWVGLYPNDGQVGDPFKSRTTLSILAFGDFNGDGLEDVLMGNQYDKQYTTVSADPTVGQGSGVHLSFQYKYYAIFVRSISDGLLTYYTSVGGEYYDGDRL